MTNERNPTTRGEARWPVALAVIGVALILIGLPSRVQLFPTWCLYVVAGVVLAALASVPLSGRALRVRQIEHAVLLAFVVSAGTSMLATLATVIRAMLHPESQLTGLQLLTSGIAVWVTNVLVFAVLYWQLDRGHHESQEPVPPEWIFPEESAAKELLPGWRPTFTCYLYLGYSTATAFSTTDVVPTSSRAKLLMMLESTISLVTVVVVAARAINLVGS